MGCKFDNIYINLRNILEYLKRIFKKDTMIVQDHTTKVGTFLPFGAGSRLCPGSNLAKLEISVYLHHFLLNYR